MLLLYISPLLVSSVLGPILIRVVAKHRNSPGASELIALILGATLWSFGYALEIISPDPNTKLFWAKFQYFGIATIPLAWFLFATRYMGSPKWLVSLRRFKLLLAVIPGLTLGLVWTNEYHQAIWQKVVVVHFNSLVMLEYIHGTWFWVYWVFSYILLIFGSIWIAYRSISSSSLMRWQIGLAVLGACIPWLGNLLYVTELNPYPNIDFTPFGFTLAGLLFTLCLFRFQLMRIIPIAQRTVFEEVASCILVLDLQNRIIDLNLASQQLIGTPYRKILGTNLEVTLPEFDSLLKWRDERQEVWGEGTVNRGGVLRFYEGLIRPLKDHSGKIIARLVTLHDVTWRKEQQEKLEKAYSELETRISERTEALQNANRQLESELAERILAEERFKDVVNSSPDSIFVVDVHGNIVLNNKKAETTFGYSTPDFARLNLSDLTPEFVGEWHAKQLTQFFTQPVHGQMSLKDDLFARRCDGTFFPIEVYLNSLKTTEGILMACVVRDLTHQKRAEQAQGDLLREIRDSREQLRALTNTLEETQEIERRNIAIELHDQVGQNLTALNLNLKSILNRLPADKNASLQSRLSDSLGLIEETTRQVRNMMADLHPPLLDEYGLLPALRWHFEKYSARTSIKIMLTGDELHARLPLREEIILFRIIQEALNNVAKHAQATQVSIHCETTKEYIRFALQDNGLGFDPSKALSNADRPHWGLLTMRERIASIGGHMTIESAPGKGTQIIFMVGDSDNGHKDSSIYRR